ASLPQSGPKKIQSGDESPHSRAVALEAIGRLSYPDNTWRRAVSRPLWQRSGFMLVSAQMSTRELLEELLAQRILLLDGSMGALIYSKEPKEEDYRGRRFRNHPVSLKNCTDALVLTQPGLIEEIHRAYLEAGADI